MALAATDVKKSLFPLLREADRAFIYMMRMLADNLRFKGIHLPKDMLTVVDVGASNMPYGVALEFWALRQAKETRVIAVDPEYSLPERRRNFFPPYLSEGLSCIEPVASYVEEAVPKLKGVGVERIDLITLFNPSPLYPLPDVANLAELCERTPIIGSVNCPVPHSVDHLVNGLSKQGYSVSLLANDVSDHVLQSYVFSYDPMFIALPKSLT